MQKASANQPNPSHGGGANSQKLSLVKLVHGIQLGGKTSNSFLDSENYDIVFFPSTCLVSVSQKGLQDSDTGTRPKPVFTHVSNCYELRFL